MVWEDEMLIMPSEGNINGAHFALVAVPRTICHSFSTSILREDVMGFLPAQRRLMHVLDRVVFKSQVVPCLLGSVLINQFRGK